MWLDSKHFPHLFDLIIDHADHDAMMVLRGTCKRACARVDARLFKNVTVTFNNRAATFRTSAGAPGVVLPYEVLSDSGRDRDLLITDPATDPAANAVLSHARIVDIHISKDCEYLYWADTDPSSVKVLRIFHTGDQPHRVGGGFMAPKLVVFCDLVQQPDIVRDWLRISATSGMTALVLNVTYDPRLCPCVEYRWYEIPSLDDYVTELVIVFGRTTAGATPSSQPAWHCERALYSVLEFVVFNTNATRKITIVGMDLVDREWVFMSSPAETRVIDHFRNHLRQGCAAMQSRKPEVTRDTSLVKFKTLEEYAAEVGAEEFAVNTAR
ncbi:hypothetical protein Q8F55_007414 [Vanrija albida]|uniref:F-box domain-containing protein n=1 Tax=Vanrija albida TaxID=181172 RepID=A0ABR3PTG2_9TREE